MSALADKIKKALGKETKAEVLSESAFFDDDALCSTSVYGLNIALDADVDGNLRPGITIFAGPSKHFKTLFCLIAAKAYLDKYPEAVIAFFDSEKGASRKYFDAVGIDQSRVIHIPIRNIEDLKFQIMKLLDGTSKEGKQSEFKLDENDKVFFFIDSIGNLASIREVDNANTENSAADMTRAKELKSLFRIITPYLAFSSWPMFAVNHTYDEMKMYGTRQMSGGQGPMLAANNVIFITRSAERNEKDKKELEGYTFTLSVEKSRTVKEKSKIPVTVKFDNGINAYTGLFDIAIQLGIIEKATPQTYKINWCDPETGELIETDKTFKKAQIELNSAFWKKVFEMTAFKAKVKQEYALGSVDMLQEADDEDIDVGIDD